MGTPGIQKVSRYGDQFKATAVALSHLPGVRVQDVAEALDIHPFMLSRWRKQVREGVIVAKPAELDPETHAELKRLRALERQYAVLKEEHAILKNSSGSVPRKRRTLPVHRTAQNRARSKCVMPDVGCDAGRLLPGSNVSPACAVSRMRACRRASSKSIGAATRPTAVRASAMHCGMKASQWGANAWRG
ncbi:MAG: hypothetical protein JWL63_786 [Rhodocyclales bacterium]|nr:hypothetical protein [Rhodocyclales bacterium]